MDLKVFFIFQFIIPLQINSKLNTFIANYFKRFRPQIVIGTGGFASGPLLQVATWLNYPTLIQEQNSYPGITNRILSKKVDRICVAFDNMEKFFPKQKIRITGNPVRDYLINLKPSKISKGFFDLDSNKKTLAVIGGSLGSKRINDLIKSELEYIMSLESKLFGNVDLFITKP